MENMRTKIMWVATLLVGTILVLQVLATSFFLYWILPWFDMLMHGLGGIWLGMMGYVIWCTRKQGKALFVVASLAALMVIVGWELMELVFDTFLGTALQIDMKDTIVDMVIGFGATLVTLLIINMLSPKSLLE